MTSIESVILEVPDPTAAGLESCDSSTTVYPFSPNSSRSAGVPST